MVWAGKPWRRKTPLVFVSNKIDSVAYVKMPQDVFEPFIESHYPNGEVLQQDRAPCHTSKFTRGYFATASITDVEWPHRSSDMNCIENCWGQLSQAVYKEGRQFDDVDELKECLTYEWENLSMDYVRSLISSMPRRIFELYSKRGSSTKY